MTTLRMPVRVRVDIVEDRLTDPTLVPLITETVDAAVGRAVDRARTVRILRERPPADESPRPTVRFTGDPLPARVAAELEASLLRVLARVPLRLGAGPDAGPGRVVVASEQAEGLDDDRVTVDEAGDDAYQVPFYDRGGDTLALPLRGRRRAGGAAGAGPERFARRLRRFATVAELWAAIMERTSGRPPSELVAVFEFAQDGAVHATFIDVGGAGGGATVRADTKLSVWSFPTGAAGGAILVRPNFAEADTWSRLDRATGQEAQRKLRQQGAIMALRATGSSATGDELRQQADELVKDLPPCTAAVTYLDQLTLQGTAVWVGESTVELPEATRPAYVFTEEVALDADEDAYGKCPPLEAISATRWLESIGLLHPDPGTTDEAFLSELALELWPPDISARLRSQMQAVASLLHMGTTKYVGAFLITAMAHIDKRCRTLARSGAPMGYQLKEMASAFGPMRDLARFYGDAMETMDRQRQLTCPLAGQSASWRLHFAEVFGSASDDAVASMFVSTCQDILLQVLFSSHAALSERAQNFDHYMPLTRLLMTVMLSDTVELMALRESLVDREQHEMALATGAGGMLGGPMVGYAWVSLTASLVDEMNAEPAPGHSPSGTVTRHRDGYRVSDGKGRWWSRAELDAVIGAQRQQVAGIDPLLDKVAGIDGLVRTLRAAQQLDRMAVTTIGHAMTSSVDDTFRDLISDLLRENERRRKQAAVDRTLAFGLATFTSDDDVASEIGARLSGIHKLADERLRPLFTDRDAYRTGLSRLAAEEIGKAEIIEFFTFVGLAALSVFCPPLAFAVGAVQAIEGLETAFEHRDLQRAMLGGDEILSKAQVEAEMWGAVIGAALTFLPEVPAVVRGAGSVTRSLVKGEAVELAGAATRQAMRRITAHLAQLSIEHFTKAFVRELVTMYLINLALGKAMSRIADAVARQTTVTGGASASDLLDILGQAIQGAPPAGGAQ